MEAFNELYSLIASPNINLVGAIYKLLLSFVLGGVIGLERHHKGQFAGMRTFSLICMGATMAMLVSIYIPQEYLGLKNGDPGRIAAQVVSGVGFLGAGAIIQMKGSVKGLTTAAGVWMTASIGLAIGAGMYIISTVATLLIIFVLSYADRYVTRFIRAGESKIIRVKVNGIMDDVAVLRDLLKQYNIHISDEFLRYNFTEKQTIINFVVVSYGKPNYVALFNEVQKTGNVASVTLTNELNN